MCNNNSAKRLLKQLADFNPSGSGDSAPNVLLPNEKMARHMGSTWDGEFTAKVVGMAAGRRIAFAGSPTLSPSI